MNHSDLMLRMDTVTKDLVGLMTSFGRVSEEKERLCANVDLLVQENFKLKCALSRIQEGSASEMDYEQAYKDATEALKEERDLTIRYSESLAQMKLTLTMLAEQFNDGQATIASLRKENAMLRSQATLFCESDAKEFLDYERATA